jgi:hypothetical protein
LDTYIGQILGSEHRGKMFLSYKYAYSKNINYDNYIIIDNNLGEIKPSKKFNTVFEALIDVYSSRKLPVAIEIVRCFLYLEKTFPSTYNRWFFEIELYKDIRAPYEEELKKYLLLM